MAEVKRRIIAVDDDRAILNVFQRALESRGYSVDTAETGQEALEKIRTGFYNLALLDIKLPDMDGTDLLDSIQESSPKMIKVMVTGYPDLENAIKSLNMGADAYVVKPISMEELLAVVKKHLNKQAQVDLSTATETFGELLQIRAKQLDEKKKLKNAQGHEAVVSDQDAKPRD